jgi:hypothetical protein
LYQARLRKARGQVLRYTERPNDRSLISPASSVPSTSLRMCAPWRRRFSRAVTKYVRGLPADLVLKLKAVAPSGWRARRGRPEMTPRDQCTRTRRSAPPAVSGLVRQDWIGRATPGFSKTRRPVPHQASTRDRQRCLQQPVKRVAGSYRVSGAGRSAAGRHTPTYRVVIVTGRSAHRRNAFQRRIVLAPASISDHRHLAQHGTRRQR